MLELIFSSFFVAVMMNWIMITNCMILYTLVLILMYYDSGEYSLKLIMFMLSLWLIMLMIMSVNKLDQKLELMIVIMILLLSLQVVFYSNSLIMFYMSFEMSVIPMLLIIFGWGYQPDRIEAAMYMLCYTVIFSLPLLLGIFFVDYFMLNNEFMFLLMLIMAFLVKFPMVGLHLWLPRAHVEAPAFGSMILAGVMLKLGGYGLIKISLLVGDLFLKFNFILIVFSVCGGCILSGMCFIQSDMKLLIAYSSVVHMSIVLSSIMTLKEIGLMGSIYMMIGHGFCSSGLFYLLGTTYDRTHSRSFYMNKGMMSIIPISSLWWFMFCSSNLSFPPCLNLVGELFLFSSILMWDMYIILSLILMSFISALYSIYLFSFSQHGNNYMTYSFQSFNLKESLICFLHWVPLNILILDLSLISFY